jgi:hypothetical protein
MASKSQEKDFNILCIMKTSVFKGELVFQIMV